MKTNQPSFTLLAVSVALCGFGVTMLVLTLAYTSDLSVLASAPMAIWSALCGQPGTDPLVLPILISLSMLSTIIGIVLLFLYRIRMHRQ